MHIVHIAQCPVHFIIPQYRQAHADAQRQNLSSSDNGGDGTSAAAVPFGLPVAALHATQQRYRGTVASIGVHSLGHSPRLSWKAPPARQACQKSLGHWKGQHAVGHFRDFHR